tara:strand:+ start:162 stop:482 length:321 start_codon:yes stop_codon:yes gene_type:complete
MSSVEGYCYECKECNYECTGKSLKQKQMLVRMHKKVCKKTGRTEEAGVFKQLHQKFAWFNNTPNSVACPKLVDTDTGVVANSFAVDRAEPMADAYFAPVEAVTDTP